MNVIGISKEINKKPTVNNNQEKDNNNTKQ